MYASPEILDQLMQTAISHYVTDKKTLKTHLKLYILSKLHIDNANETYLKYMYPICHAVEYLDSLGFDKYDSYIFREAWRIVWRLTYTENNNWLIERDKIIEKYNYDRDDVNLVMLIQLLKLSASRLYEYYLHNKKMDLSKLPIYDETGG